MRQNAADGRERPRLILAGGRYRGREKRHLRPRHDVRRGHFFQRDDARSAMRSREKKSYAIF